MTAILPNKPNNRRAANVGEPQRFRDRRGKRGKLINYTEDFELRRPDEIIRGTLPRTGVGFLAGQSGALKTFTAIELAFCIATGQPFAGRKVEQSGGVLFFAFEGAGTLPARIKARRSRLDDPAEELPLLVVENFGPIFTPKDYMDFREEVEHVRLELIGLGVPLSAVIIDTVIAAGMIAEDRENDPAAWQRIFDGLQPISKEMKAPIILVHHYGKDQSSGLRGSSNARAGADFVLAMTCQRDELTGDTSGHKLALTKSRDAPEGPIADVHPIEVQVGTYPDGAPWTSLVLSFERPGRDEGLPSMSVCRSILDELKAAWDGGNPYSLSPQSKKTGRYAVRALAKRFDVEAPKVERLLTSWLDNEIIRVDVFDARNKRSGINVIGILE